jgi:hypothetical protein
MILGSYFTVEMEVQVPFQGNSWYYHVLSQKSMENHNPRQVELPIPDLPGLQDCSNRQSADQLRKNRIRKGE